MNNGQKSDSKAGASNVVQKNNPKAVSIPALEAVPKTISKKDLSVIPEDLARKYKMVVFERDGNVIKVAMVHPQNVEALNILRFMVEKDKLDIQTYVTSPKIFQEIASKYSTTEKALKEAVLSLESEKEEDFRIREKTEDEYGKSGLIQDAPIAKLVQVVVKHAIDGRASDIHIEPNEGQYRVRYRVDGILHSSLTLPKPVGKAVVSRIKILSDLKIDEKRKPQDGRFQVEEGGKQTDFRVSTLPVVEGEKVVMRVLDKSGKSFDLKALGLWGRNHEILVERIKDPFGIVLMTGPTGSGKSTTLYGFLQILNQEERNIITLEDPVEYFVEGVNQSQIKPEIGYSFANGLRSILRQDPNVIMVGEIRDSETAELAIHAALTGHLIFSTVHTNDAIGSIPRLVDMGVEPFLLSSSLRVIAAQRLVRKICEKCKHEVKIPESVIEQVRKDIEEIPKEELDKYEVDLSVGLKFHRGKGCDECGNLGYKGRLAIFEVMDVNNRVQEIISAGKEIETELKREAKSQGMIKLRQDGILKVLKGLTTLAEVERVTEGSFAVGGDLEDDKG